MYINSNLADTYKKILPIIIPVVGAVVLDFANGLIDSIMISNYKTEMLGAVTLANSLFFSVNMVFFGIMTMLAPLLGQAFGESDMQKGAKVIQNGLIVGTFFALFLFFTYTVAPFIMPYLIDTSTYTYQAASEYIDTRKYSVFIFAVIAFRYYLSAQKIVKPLLIGSIITIILNTFGNWIFIYGNLGVPALGAYGAGLATSITTIILYLYYTTLSITHIKRYNFPLSFKSLEIDTQLLKKFLWLGLPIGITITIEMSLFTAGNIISTLHSQNTLTVFAIIYQIWAFCFAFSFGTAEGLEIYCANEAGKRNRINIIKAYKASFILVFIAYTVTCAILWVNWQGIFSIFTNTPYTDTDSLYAIFFNTLPVLIIGI